eukprot:m.98309 g.98309  ORF g.98309 m.98309 type:complete len:737 (-) comp27050_c1_seq1:33-2243(-)
MAAAVALKQAVEHSLQWYNYDNAIFLAERLVGEERNDETLLVLATAHFRAGRYSNAYSILNAQKSPSCRFLFARCCLELDRLQEGELALTGELFPGASTDITGFHETQGAAYALLGQICEKAHRTEQAITCYKKSLDENCFMWSSFESLCKLGVKPDPASYFQPGSSYPEEFQISKTPRASFDTLAPMPHTPIGLSTPLPNRPESATTPGGNSFQTPTITPGFGVSSFALVGSAASIPVVSALGSPTPWSYNTPSPSKTPRGGLNSVSTPPIARPDFGGGGETAHLDGGPPPAVRKSLRLAKTGKSSPGVRRSMRLFSSSKGKSKETRSAAKDLKKSSRLSKSALEPIQTPAQSDTISAVDNSVDELRSQSLVGLEGVDTDQHSHDAAVRLLLQLGKAIGALAQFDCKTAIDELASLPLNQYNTAWTYCQLGRAYFELADYKQADESFRMARRLEPYRSQGMEIYSTTLWHLRQETALSYLAHEVIAADRLSPEAWCVVGNCFSLQKEHDAAVKFFERAVQLDPSFSYAYTLLGHEYVYNEDFGKALTCFRNAVHSDARHYNAWYGLGMIYYRQEKYELAEYHFQKAIQINPGSAILLCYLGIVQHAQNKSRQALKNMNLASELDNHNPLVKFNKAVVLAAIERNQDALEELTELKRLAPKESSVYFLMGKIYRKIGEHDTAMMHLSWAIDLDPKGSNNLLKEAIDNHQPDDDGSLSPDTIELPTITSPLSPDSSV